MFKPCLVSSSDEELIILEESSCSYTTVEEAIKEAEKTLQDKQKILGVFPVIKFACTAIDDTQEREGYTLVILEKNTSYVKSLFVKI